MMNSGDAKIPSQTRRFILTVEEAAEALGVGRTTMYGLLAAGMVESVRIGRLRRIPVDALTSYVDGLRANGGDGR
jgi:excisionase family DNA binding protein